MFYTLYSKVLDCFLNQEFDNYSIDQGDSISKDVFTSLMKSISGQVSGKEINNYMDKKKLNLEEFKAIYRALLNLQKYQRCSLIVEGFWKFKGINLFALNVPLQGCDLLDNFIAYR